MNAIKLLLIFILKFCLFECSYILIDNIFKRIQIDSPNCNSRGIKFDTYRGAITHIDDIEDNSMKIKSNISYSFIYFPTHEKFNNYINYIPESTLVFTSFQIEIADIHRNLCFLKLDHWSKYHYIFISEKQLIYLAFPLIFGFLYMDVSFSVYKEFNIRTAYRGVYFYKFVKYNFLISQGIALSAITIYYFLPSYVLYSFYKSNLLMNLILILEGFSIFHFNDCRPYFKKYVLIIFAFDSLTAIFSLYIVYIFPFINNFYLLHFKSFIEHGTLLVIIFVFFYKKYIRIHKQYLLEKRLGTILAEGYKIKKVIYLKLMIFAIVYCSAFIIMPFIEKLYIKIDNCVETFYINYFIIICMELVFNIVLAIILFPQELTMFFFLPTIFDFNTFKLEAIVKNQMEDKFNISNLTRDLLINEYEKKEYPLIFLHPFAKTDKLFDDNIGVGLTKKQTNEEEINN
jgi:hypothetical protein